MFQKYWRKFIDLLINSLKQGITPGQLSVTITVGILIGIIPVLGVTTAILAIIAFRFKLNMAVIQIANYAVYPLQLLLLVPFLKFGKYVFKGPKLNVGFQELYHAFVTEPFTTLLQFSRLTVQAALVWLLLSVPTGLLLYYLLLIPLRRMSMKIELPYFKNSR